MEILRVHGVPVISREGANSSREPNHGRGGDLRTARSPALPSGAYLVE